MHHSSTPTSSRSEVTTSGLSCGLLVDWLERLDPEVTTVCPDLQQKLLFALNKVSSLSPSSFVSDAIDSFFYFTFLLTSPTSTCLRPAGRPLTDPISWLC